MEVLGSELSSELRESLDRCASSALPCSEIATSPADACELVARRGGQEVAPKKWRQEVAPKKWRTTDHAMKKRAGRARLRRYAGHRGGSRMSCRAGGGRSCSYPFSVRSGGRFRRGRCADETCEPRTQRAVTVEDDQRAIVGEAGDRVVSWLGVGRGLAHKVNESPNVSLQFSAQSSRQARRINAIFSLLFKLILDPGS